MDLYNQKIIHPPPQCFTEIKKSRSFLAIKMWNSYTSDVPNACAWEQQKLNKIKKQAKKVRRQA